MVGRHRNSEGINYPFDEEVSKLNKKGYLTGIDFDSLVKDYQIIVMNHQPGIGKTYTVMDYIMRKSREDDNFSFFYFTDRHKAIEERLANLKEKNITKDDKKIIEGFAHWKGFGKHCDNELVDRLLEFNVPIDRIKGICDVDEHYKRYIEQFNYTKRVFAPFNYLSNEHFKNKNSKPAIVFLDERISHIETYTFNKDKIAKALKLIKAPPEYLENAGNKKFFWDKSVRKNIEHLYYNSVISAITKGRKRLNVYKEFNPYKLFEYLRWSKIYNYKIDMYSFPIYYNALDVVTTKDVPIVILDATFNENLFSYFLESYNGEMRKMRSKSSKGFNNLKVKILQSKVSNSATRLYRMRPGGCWPKRSFTEYKDSTWEWLLTDLKELREIFGDANIGIITYKELSWLFEAMNFDVEYFGNLRGTNLLEDKLVLVIVGTWVPLPPSWINKDKKKDKKRDKKKDYIDYLVEKYFLLKITKDNVVQAGIGAPLTVEFDYPELYDSKDSKSRLPVNVESKLINDEGMRKYYDLKDAEKVAQYPISAINTIWFDEIYQAFHRNRGLTNKRIIFSYAWFPERSMMIKLGEKLLPEPLTKYNLRREFPSTKVLDDEYKDFIFSRYRNQCKGGLMQDLMKHIELDENVDVIQKKFKIHKKGKSRGAYTPPIKGLKDAYKYLKDLIEYKES